MSSSHSAKSLYNDDDSDDIVDTRSHRHHHHSSSSSSSSSHRHHHSGANSRFQEITSSASNAEIALRRLPGIVIRLVIFAVLAVLCFTLWKQTRELKRNLANYEGTNAIMNQQAVKFEAEKKALLLEAENLRHDLEEQKEIVRALRIAIENAASDTADGAEEK